MIRSWFSLLTLGAILAGAPAAWAQTAPSAAELRAYTGLHAAAAQDDVETIQRLVAGGAAIDATDAHGRTPLQVAVHAGNQDAARALLAQGADPNSFDIERYDPVTIAAVRNDVAVLQIVLAGGGSAKNITSPYDGTALIAAAHLGFPEVVTALIAADAPLDHVNNLGWTALIEAIVLGDGGPSHVATLQALVRAGANVNIADRTGTRPLSLARRRGYDQMAAILERAGAH
jgi:ankyrin repeat protein